MPAWSEQGRWGTLIGSCPSFFLRKNSFLNLANQSPPPPTLVAAWRLGQIRPRRVLKRSLASTGHRGRVDARGQPPGGAPGLTRTTGLSAVVPSRDGRWRVAFGERAWEIHAREETRSRLPGIDSPPQPQSPGGRLLGTRSSQRSAEGVAHRPSREGAPAPRSAVRVKPGAQCQRWPRALTRPRWPVSAKNLIKIDDAVFVPTAHAPPARTVGDSDRRG